jgi:hypothetical protein
MVAGTSGATPGSGATEGDDDNDGRLKLPHAPTLRDQIMAFPPNKFLAALLAQPSVKLLSEQ